MILYIIPAVLAFIITAFMLFQICMQGDHSKVIFTMVLVFLIHHGSEIAGFSEFIQQGNHVLYQLKIYYMVSIWALIVILMHCLDVSKTEIKHATKVLITLATGLSILILYGDQVIKGSSSLGYVMTAIKGPLYYVFQASALFLLTATIAILINGYRKATNHLTQIQCSYMLLAFTPLLGSSLLILALMALGFKINAIAIMPIATTLFIIITLKSESKHKLTDIRRFMPYSPERKTSQDVMEIYSRYARDEMPYRDCISEIEKLLVLHKYGKSGKNASATAQSMGMPRSSLYSIFNRLRIDVNEQ